MSERITAKHVGRRASARWAYPHDLSQVCAEGQIIGYCDAPQVLIETDGGVQMWWRADLTVLAPESHVEATGSADRGAGGVDGRSEGPEGRETRGDA